MRLVALITLLLLLTACGEPGATSGARHSSPSPASESLPSTSSRTPRPHRAENIEQRCGDPVPGQVFRIRADGGRSRIAAIRLGHSPTVAVLLHQTDGSGLCGWVPYANWLQHQGISAIAIDQCAYGESVCTDRMTADETLMLRTVIDWVRRHHARRVVVVGASMGGSVALAAGQRAGADAIVDLSGPAHWYGVAAATAAAPRVRVPLLVVANRETDPDEFPALPRAVALSPARPKRFVNAPPAHGWDLLTSLRDGAELRTDITATRIGRLVLGWIRGPRSAAVVR